MFKLIPLNEEIILDKEQHLRECLMSCFILDEATITYQLSEDKKVAKKVADGKLSKSDAKEIEKKAKKEKLKGRIGKVAAVGAVVAGAHLAKKEVDRYKGAENSERTDMDNSVVGNLAGKLASMTMDKTDKLSDKARKSFNNDTAKAHKKADKEAMTNFKEKMKNAGSDFSKFKSAESEYKAKIAKNSIKHNNAYKMRKSEIDNKLDKDKNNLKNQTFKTTDDETKARDKVNSDAQKAKAANKTQYGYEDKHGTRMSQKERDEKDDRTTFKKMADFFTGRRDWKFSDLDFLVEYGYHFTIGNMDTIMEMNKVFLNLKYNLLIEDCGALGEAMVANVDIENFNLIEEVIDCFLSEDGNIYDLLY